MRECCPICGIELEYDDDVSYKGGWRVCSHHRVIIKPAQYAGRCHVCLGPVLQNETILLIRNDDDNAWIIIHRKDCCEGNVSLLPAATVADSAYSALYVTSNAPAEVIKAAYRALAYMYHPDRGGDPSKMQEINAALAKIIK